MMKKKYPDAKRIIRAVILLIAVAAISVAATKIFYELYSEASIYDFRDINATFRIGNSVGLSGETDKLNFGIVPMGGTSTKEIIVSNPLNKTVEIKIAYFGNITSVLSYIEPFKLDPYGEKKIKITAYAINIKNSTSYGGTIRVLYMRPQ